MPGPWNDVTDKQLLLIIIYLTAPALPKWDQVAEKMGDGFTAESVRQHYQKLRKIAEQEIGGVSLGNKKAGSKQAAGEASPKTPKSKSGAGSKRKRAKVELEGLEADNDADEEDLKKIIKAEVGGGSDEDEV